MNTISWRPAVYVWVKRQYLFPRERESGRLTYHIKQRAALFYREHFDFSMIKKNY